MGVIDDYYGGYENMYLYTNSDGEFDYEAAYYHDLDNYYDEDYGMEDDPIGMTSSYYQLGDSDDMVINPDFYNSEIDEYSDYEDLNMNCRDEEGALPCRMLKAVVQGRFSYNALRGLPAFQQAVQKHRDAQADAGGTLARVMYKSGTAGEKYVTTDDEAFDALPKGLTVDVEWWEKSGGEGGHVDKITFQTYKELQAHKEHIEHKMGPLFAGWCHQDCDFSNPMNKDIFWSAFILWKECGSSGIKHWDRQIEELVEMPTDLYFGLLRRHPGPRGIARLIQFGKGRDSIYRESDEEWEAQHQYLMNVQPHSGKAQRQGAGDRGRGQQQQQRGGGGRGQSQPGQKSQTGGQEGKGKNWAKNQRRRRKQKEKRQAQVTQQGTSNPGAQVAGGSGSGSQPQNKGKDQQRQEHP